jgi:hypothetical protein
LGWLLSDAASIGLGLLGLILLLLVRVFGEDPYASAAAGAPEAASDLALAAARQTRSDLLAVLACLTVLSNGVARLDVESALAETVELEGVRVSAPLVAVVGDDLERLGRVSCWFLETMLVAAPASSAVLLVAAAAAAGSEPASAEPSRWKVACAAGALPSSRLAELSVPPASPVLDRAAKESSGKDETYLPNLQALPARTEFLGYLPANTQAVLAIPVVLEPASKAAAVVVLGSNRARSFAPRDIVRCQALAARLGAVASVG